MAFSALPGFTSPLAAPDLWSALFGASRYWASTMLLIGLMVFFIVTLIYMLGVAFQLPHLKSWAKSEYMEVIITFLLAAALLAASAQVWSLMVDSVSAFYKVSHPEMADPGLYYEPFSFAQSFINTTLIGCEKNVYAAIYPVNFYYRVASRLEAATIGNDPAGGWYTSAYTGFFEYVTGHVQYLLLLHYIQIRFLSLIKYMMPLLIQIGLILRVFPYSRGAGGLLMAIGFGFFIVYPISIAMLMTLLPSPSHSFCTGFQPPPLLDMSALDCVQTPGALLQVKMDIAASAGQTGGLISQLQTFLPVFYIQGMFLPLVALIITFTFIRQTGALFGADLAEIGRGLIKLI